MCVCQNLLPPEPTSGVSWYLAQNFKNVPCAFSFVERSVKAFPLTHYHIFVNIINPMTLAGSLETKRLILEREKSEGVQGLLPRTKQNMNYAVIISLLCILRVFSPSEKNQKG